MASDVIAPIVARARVRAEPLSVAVDELRNVMRGIDLGEQP